MYVAFLKHSSAKTLSQSWERPVRPFPKVWERFEKPRATAKEIGKQHGGARPFSHLRLETSFLRGGANIPPSRLRKKSYFRKGEQSVH